MPQRYVRPQPFEELDHTADAGVRVRGEDPEEALARLVLAYADLVCGGEALSAEDELVLAVDPADHASMAIDVLRELLYLFETEKRIPASCEVLTFDPIAGARLKLEMGRYDASQHGEGVALKAVTLHAARFEPVGDSWLAQVVFDI